MAEKKKSTTEILGENSVILNPNLKFWALLAGDPHQARATALLDFELVGGRPGKFALTRSGAGVLP